MLRSKLIGNEGLVTSGGDWQPFSAAVGSDVTLTNLTSGQSVVSDPVTTASVSPTAGSVTFLCVGIATVQAESVPLTGECVPTGCRGTWTQIGYVVLSGRRAIYAFKGTGSITAEAISIDFTGTAWQETMWSVEDGVNVNTTTPNDTTVTGSALSGTALNLGDVGTLDAGDVVFSFFGFEDGADSFAIGAPTALGSQGGGANLRQIKTGYDASGTPDETPGATWATDGNGCSGIGFIVNKA